MCMEETMELTQEERKSMSYLAGERKQCAECKTQFFPSKA